MAKTAPKDPQAALIERRFRFAADQQRTLFDDFARYRSLWESKITDPGGYPWDYALFSPMVYSTIRSLVARIASGNVGVDLQAWNEGGRPKTRINKALLDWEFNEVDLFMIVSRWVFASALYGKGFVGTGWLHQKEQRIEEEDDKGDTKRSVTVRPKINRADLTNLRTMDLFIANRNIPELQAQPWVVHRLYRTLGELKRDDKARGGNIYRNLDKLTKRDYFVRVVDYGHDLPDDQNDKKEKNFDSGVLEILRLWDREKGTVVEKIRGHDDLILRDEDNPFYHGEIPIVELPFFPEDDEFWNAGIVGPMEDLQIADNSILNQYLTNANQQLNNMWIQEDGKPVPEWELINRPNGIIHGKVTPVEHRDITGVALPMLGAIEQRIQRTSGISDQLAVGTPASNVNTATGQQIQQENLDANLKHFMTILEQFGIKRVAKQFLAMNAQYITDEQVIAVTGRHGYSHMTIKPDEVSAEFDPIVIPNSTIPKNPMIRVQNLLNVQALAAKDPKVQINTAPIWKDIIDAMGMTDLDEVVPDDIDEAMQENELLRQGVPVECEPNDNHGKHIQIHQYPLIAGDLDAKTTKRFVDHIKAHKNWKLAADENLLDKLGMGAKPIPGEISDMAQRPPEPPQTGLPPQGAPMTGMPGLPLPNAATGLDGITAQMGQMLSPQAPQGAPLPIPQGGGF